MNTVKLTLQHSTGAEMSKSHQHEISQHFDIIVVVEAVLDVFQKLKDVNAIKTRVKQCVHALKRCLHHTSSNLINVHFSIIPDNHRPLATECT